MRILIADDDRDFRNFLNELLVKWGHQVTAVGNGDEALQALTVSDAPRLAILDWVMPGIDGVELCRRIRREVRKPYTYLILLTAQQQDEDLVVGMEAGADDYLRKPLNIKELRVRINAGERLIKLQNELAARAADLELVNRDLEDFSYTCANDLLKALLSIGESAKSIQDLYCGTDEQCRAYTHRIYEKTRQLGRLIAIMHKYFSPTRKEFHLETVDLSKMADESANRLRLSDPKRQVAFKIPEGITAQGDKKLLQEVLDNLIGNAWKHTGNCDDAAIEFGVTDVEGKPAYFVRDNGAGFDMTHADKLFRLFQQLPGTEEMAGQGIGLASVERTIRRHGGKVWAEGVPGKGATFYFTL